MEPARESVSKQASASKSVSMPVSKLLSKLLGSQLPVAAVQGPQLVIMVPTRELGVQIVMLIYKLFGGAVNSQVPGDAANMFTYTGPRGLKVGICGVPNVYADWDQVLAWGFVLNA